MELQLLNYTVYYIGSLYHNYVSDKAAILCRVAKVIVSMLLVVENLRSWQLRFIISVICFHY